jgi:hypothetical protein
MHLCTSVSGIPSILTGLSGTRHEKLEKDNYPCIQFWTRADWTEFDDNMDVNEDLGCGMRFLEDEDGCVITPTRASLIRDQARSIWNQIGTSNASLLPTSWGQVGLNLCQLFNKQMRAEFKEFQYCEADWKAKAFAMEYYPNWYRKHANSKVKSEDSGVLPNATSSKPRKQPHSQEGQAVNHT